MSLSPQVRSAECKALLEILLSALGTVAIDQALFDPSNGPFESIHNTTWDELEAAGWLELLKSVGAYRFTGTGWLGALRLIGSVYTKEFEEGAGLAIAAMKRHVKGRDRPAVVPLREIADEAHLPEGFVFNIVESRLLEEHHGRIGPVWQDRGRMILIPRGFDIPPTDLNALICEATENLIEELRERIEIAECELAQYRCPHCKSALGSTGGVELSEHDSGTYEIFECGYSTLDGTQTHPCPKDPKYPKLDEFEFKTVKQGDEWMCYAVGKTPYAKQLSMLRAPGKTEEQARNRVIADYNFRAGRVSNAKYIDDFTR